MRGRRKHELLFMMGMLLVLLSQFVNGLSGMWVYEPFLFPVAFVVAAVYGWWSMSYVYSFLVGFFSIPYFIPLPPFFSASIPYVFVITLLGLADYNLRDLLILLGIGGVSGLIGVGSVRLRKLVS